MNENRFLSHTKKPIIWLLLGQIIDLLIYKLFQNRFVDIKIKIKAESSMLMSFDDFYFSVNCTMLDCIPRKVKGVIRNLYLVSYENSS